MRPIEEILTELREHPDGAILCITMRDIESVCEERDDIIGRPPFWTKERVQDYRETFEKGLQDSTASARVLNGIREAISDIAWDIENSAHNT